MSGEPWSGHTKALDTSRNIGTAIGILMATHRLTQDQAFLLLRVASQHTHRKVHDLARDVIDTGTLDISDLPTDRLTAK